MRTLFDRPACPDPSTPVAPAEPTMGFECRHACAVCGSPASFGFGVGLRNDRPGRWACFEHRDVVESMKGSRR